MVQEEPVPEEKHSLIWRFLGDLLETVLLALVVLVAVRSTVQHTLVQQHSMEPTLHEGQHIMVSKLAYLIGDPKRGEIAVFHSPQGGPDLIKRVIGTPGDKVQIISGKVYINDALLDEPYVVLAKLKPNWGPVVLGNDEYLMLGDNRDNSNDSRAFGPIKRSTFVGRAWFSLWPLAQVAYASSR